MHPFQQGLRGDCSTHSLRCSWGGVEAYTHNLVVIHTLLQLIYFLSNYLNRSLYLKTFDLARHLGSPWFTNTPEASPWPEFTVELGCWVHGFLSVDSCTICPLAPEPSETSLSRILKHKIALVLSL